MRVLRERLKRPVYADAEHEDLEEIDSEPDLEQIEKRSLVLRPLQIANADDPPPIWQCYSCELGFRDHPDFYLHVFNKHLEIMDKSMRGKVARHVKKGRIFCMTCRNCFDSHDEHETNHYSTKKGKGALIECTNCYRTFDTVEEMKHHHARVHGTVRMASYQSCCVCDRLFSNRNVRDQHFITHFPSVVQRIMEKVDQMHVFMGEYSVSNQCPLCGFIVSTRKSLRQHTIFQHVLKSTEDLHQLIDTTNVDQDELAVVMRVVNNPDLLWKRTRQTVSECEPQRRPEKLKVRAYDDLDDSLLKKIKLEPVSEGEEVAEEEHNAKSKTNSGDQLRAFMLRMGVDPTNPSRCRICGEDAEDRVLLEVHLALNHLSLARSQRSGASTTISSDESDSSSSSA